SRICDDAAAGFKKKREPVEQMCRSCRLCSTPNGFPRRTYRIGRFVNSGEHRMLFRVKAVRVIVKIFDWEAAAQVYMLELLSRFAEHADQTCKERFECRGVNCRVGILRTDMQVNATDVYVRRIGVFRDCRVSLIGHHPEL